MSKPKVIGISPATMDEDLLIWAASRECARQKPVFMILELGAVEAITLSGALELVLRHPGVQAGQRIMIERVAKGIEAVTDRIGPAVAEMNRRSHKNA